MMRRNVFARIARVIRHVYRNQYRVKYKSLCHLQCHVHVCKTEAVDRVAPRRGNDDCVVVVTHFVIHARTSAMINGDFAKSSRKVNALATEAEARRANNRA